MVSVLLWVGFQWLLICYGFRCRWFGFSSGLGFDGYDFALGFDFSGLGFGGFGFVVGFDFGGFGFPVGGGLGFGFSVDKMVEGGGGGGGDGGVSGGRRKIHR